MEGGRGTRRRRLEVAKKARSAEETKANAKKERARAGRVKRIKRDTARQGWRSEREGGWEGARGDLHGCWYLRGRSQAREGKRGENKLKAKLYSHKKMELFLDAVPPRYEEKEG